MKGFLKTFGLIIILLSVVIFVWASTVPPSGSIVEEHESTESSSYVGKYQGYQLKQAQQFYLDSEDTQPLSGIGILLKSTDYGSPTGDLTIAIYDNAQGNIPGLLITGSTKSFSPVLGQWNYISYSGSGITLNTGSSNKYWIVVTVPEQSGDNDAYCWYRSSSNTYDRGYRKTHNMSGSNTWDTQSGDFAFRIYGDLTLDVTLPEIVPTECHLFSNYPNPFNPLTTIRYHILAKVSGRRVSIRVYNLLGHEVVTLADGIHQPGDYAVFWDGCDDQGMEVPSGIYLYRLISEGKTVETKRMLKMK